MAQVKLHQHRKKRLETGHPWIFQSEVMEIAGEVEPGDIVEVTNHKGHFLAKGYINPSSQMIVRILSYDPQETIDYSFSCAGSDKLPSFVPDLWIIRGPAG